MSELEDKINSILSDPDQMDQINRLASQLMGGEAPGNGGMPDLGDLMRGLGGLGSLGTSGGSGGSKAALLSAITPYISEKRASKLQKAIRFAQLARIAGSALAQRGGE